MRMRVPLRLKKYRLYHQLKKMVPSRIKERWFTNLEEVKAHILKNNVQNNEPIVPAMMTMELTNHCNAKCTFCTQPDIMQRPKNFMTDEVMEKCLEQIKLHNISEVMLAGMGEPFMYKKVLQLISRLKKIGVVVSVTTNGSILYIKDPKDIVNSGLDYLLVSMDAIETEWLRESKPGICRPVEKIEQDIRAIYDYKINVSLIKDVAKKLPHCSFVFIGPIDENAIFYLRSRGMSKNAATKIKI